MPRHDVHQWWKSELCWQVGQLWENGMAKMFLPALLSMIPFLEVVFSLWGQLFSHVFPFFCYSCSAWSLRQSKLFEDAEASLTVCLPLKLVLLTKISLQFGKKNQIWTWDMWRNSTSFFYLFFFLQRLHLHREAWQTGCFLRALLCEYLHVSSSCLKIYL